MLRAAISGIAVAVTVAMALTGALLAVGSGGAGLQKYAGGDAEGHGAAGAVAHSPLHSRTGTPFRVPGEHAEVDRLEAGAAVCDASRQSPGDDFVALPPARASSAGPAGSACHDAVASIDSPTHGPTNGVTDDPFETRRDDPPDEPQPAPTTSTAEPVQAAPPQRPAEGQSAQPHQPTPHAAPASTPPPAPTAAPTAVAGTPTASNNNLASSDAARSVSTPWLASSPREAGLLDAMNEARRGAGLEPLRIDAGLTTIARHRSHDMSASGYFAHVSPTGETWLTLVGAAGIRLTAGGENLARVAGDVERSVSVAIEKLLQSPTHRANILSDRYSRVGVGAVTGADGVTVFTAIFAD